MCYTFSSITPNNSEGITVHYGVMPKHGKPATGTSNDVNTIESEEVKSSDLPPHVIVYQIVI